MKKIFTIIALLALTLTAGAKDFTDQLSISLNGGRSINIRGYNIC